MHKSSGNGLAVGLGLANECHLAWAHCYRDQVESTDLSTR
jgi:hypothetical protein